MRLIDDSFPDAAKHVDASHATTTNAIMGEQVRFFT
jgi:hypothetical protein